MELIELMRERHSVRIYKDTVIPIDIRNHLNQLVEECNKESGLHIQMCYDEPNAFNSMMARYGKFKNVNNYIAIVGKKDEDINIGYYGEKLVLEAQKLGLNTCWVGISYKKGKAAIQKNKGEKLHIVISLGYGDNQGFAHKNKSIDQVLQVEGEKPEWLDLGVEAALLAPTAMNQQKFIIHFKNGELTLSEQRGFYAKVDLGIVKYHLEVVTNKKVKTDI